MKPSRTRTLCATFVLALSSAVAADTLRDVYDLALKNDPKLKIAEATFRADRENAVQGRSGLLPQINADASYGRQYQDREAEGITDFGPDLTPVFGGVDTDTRTTNRGWGVALSQPLFDLPAWFDFKRGREISRQAQAQLGADQQDLIVRTADAYFSVLRARDNLQVAQAEERAAKRQLDQAQQRFDVGLIAITDIHEARAAFDASVAVRIGEDGNLATAYEGLTALTGQEHANLWLLSRELPVTNPEPNDRAAWVQFALDNNLTLKAARYAMQAAEEYAAAKRYEHAPTLSGNLSYQKDRVDGSIESTPQSLFDLPPDADTTTRAAVLKLTVPLYSGGFTSSASRQAHEQHNAAIERRVDTERGVIQATRARHIATTTDVQRVKARAQSIVSAQSALDASSAGYEVGTRNIVDVLQVQRTFFAAQRDYANARYDYVLDLLRLKQQAGTLSPKDIYDLNVWLVAPESPKASSYSEASLDFSP